MSAMSEFDFDSHQSLKTKPTAFQSSTIALFSVPEETREPRCTFGIDSERYMTKPDNVGAIKARLKSSEKTVQATLGEFITAIKQGRTICPAEIVGTAHNAENWRSQQIFCVDIDNAATDKSRLPDDKYISIDKAKKILADNEIDTFFIYWSFSNKKAEWGKQEHSKFRICVRLDVPVTDTTERERIITAFIELFGDAADKSCKNADRIFFGSKPDCSVYENVKAVTPKSVFLALYDKLFPTVTAPMIPQHSFSSPVVSGGNWSRAFDFNIDKLLYSLDPDSSYDDWIKATAAYKGAGGDIETWARWSAQSPKWKTNDRKRWDSFKGTSREALINLAKATSKGKEYMEGQQQAQNEAKKKYNATQSGGEWGKRKAKSKEPNKADTPKEEEKICFNGKIMSKEEVINFIKNHPFLEGTEISCKINTIRLYDFFLKDRKYLLVSSERSSDVRIFEYRNGVYVMIDERRLKSEINAVIKDNGAKSFVTTRVINEVYTLITYEKEFMVDESKLNANENIINFKNGILHLDTMKLTEHSPLLLSTIQIPCNWIGEQPTPLFDRFMSTFTQDDMEKILLFLEFMGGAISNYDGTKHFKKALFVVGKSNSGKSVLRNLITLLIGEQHQSGVSLARLEERFGAMELYQRRLVGSPDLGYPSIKQAEIFKNVTGGDYIPIEQKNQPMFQYRYKGFMWFGCNRLPKFPPDTATYNRMIIVECSNVIPEEQQDRMLIPKLLEEASGIVYKAVMAIKAAVERGHFTIPAESNELMKHYRVENSIYMQFYEECCEERSFSDKNEPVFNDNVTAATILRVAKEWLIKNYPSSKFSKSTFKRELEAEGVYMKEYRNSKARFFAFTLNDEAKAEFHIYDTLEWGKTPPPITNSTSSQNTPELDETPF